MSEYECLVCGKVYKTARGLDKHVSSLHPEFMKAVEAWAEGAASVTPSTSQSIDGQPGETVEQDGLKAVTAGRTGAGSSDLTTPKKGDNDGGSVEEDPVIPYEELPDDTPVYLTKGNLNTILKDIATINANVQRQGSIITTLTDPGAQKPQAANWDGLGAEWEKLPKQLQDALTGFLGNIGKAAVRFAGGGGDDELSEEQEVLLEVFRQDKASRRERIISRAQVIRDAMSNPELELYTRKKPPAPVRKDEVQQVG